VVVVVVVLLEGCDRLDIVRIIITDVGTDVVREGRERERDGWLHIKRSRHDDADKYIYQTDVNPLAQPPWPSPLWCYLHYTTRR
jgi:hypothetical protein